ncbi:hypothetical protein [Sinomonas sp. P47F7]|uniref:hypothetical protein n=1 Tax=Sinomonas sp. P47F7 TaxID=3410987 RepID=UPI003BF4E58F
MAPSRFLPLRRSARATIVFAAAGAALSALTAWTLEGWAAALALAALGGFVLCALYAILGMNRYWVAAGGLVTTALTVGCALAFLRVLGLAWDDAADRVTTVSSRDADPYFLGAAGALLTTFAVLFVGAVWPQRRRQPRRPAPASGNRARSGTPTRATRQPAQRTPSPSLSGRAPASAPRPAARRNG